MIKRLAIFTSVFAAFLVLSPLNVFSATDHVVINEIQINGGTGYSNNDFIEFYNPTDSDYDLTGHRLVKRSADATADESIKVFENGTTIPARSYFLWSNSGWDPGVTPDSSTSATLAGNNGIALRNGAANTGEIIDSVAWGTVTNAFIEGSPYPDNPDANTSIQRVDGDDTNNNSIDFVINNSPSPQNSAVSVTPSPSPTQSPSPTPTASESPSPSPSPSPTPTESPSPSPTLSPSPTPSPSPLASPTVEPTSTPEPTITPQPTVTPSPTATPRSVFLGAFPFGHKQKVCYLVYQQYRFGFAHVWFPKVKCVKI